MTISSSREHLRQQRQRKPDQWLRICQCRLTPDQFTSVPRTKNFLAHSIAKLAASTGLAGSIPVSSIPPVVPNRNKEIARPKSRILDQLNAMNYPSAKKEKEEAPTAYTACKIPDSFDCVTPPTNDCK